MAFGSLWITFLFARDILGRPWLGVLAGIFLIALDMQTFYATSPRMYMTFQFFSMLAFYSGWRAFICRESKFRLLTFLAVALAVLTHIEAAILIISIPASLLAFTLFRERKIPSVSPRSLYSPQIAIGVLVIIVTVFLRYVYDIPGGMPLISDHGGSYKHVISPQVRKKSRTSLRRQNSTIAPVEVKRRSCYIKRSITRTRETFALTSD